MAALPTQQEAPEGIVIYSWSGFAPFGAAGNAVSIGNNAFIDPSDFLGTKYPAYEFDALTDTLIETIDLVSEGVIEGPLSGIWILSGSLGNIGWTTGIFSGYTPPTGLSSGYNWLRSVYWNQLPVLSDAGQFNFQNISAAYSVGNPNGDILQSIEQQETTSRTIGTRLYGGTENSQTFRILNQNCKGVIVNIKIPALSWTDTNSNINRAAFQYQIYYRPIFSNILSYTTISNYSQFVLAASPFIFGKISTAGGYISSTQIDFNITSYINQNNTSTTDTVGFLNDPNFVGWEVQVVRLTPDSSSALIVNASYIDSITELYGSQLTYPNSAMFRATFDGQFFSSVPDRAFECKLLQVQIPGNYDPIRRAYNTGGYATTNGYWNGQFATGNFWTDNPAWCFYDLITNRRYGLGKYVENLGVNKFDLYQIGQYCDELVADGYGGLEPRFSCNLWLAQKEESFKVINDMASIFRGLAYYFNGNLNATQDAPKITRTVFTNANVENGDFTYSSTSKKTRQSVAVVRYNDPTNFYAPALEYIEDLDAIRKYGVRELYLTAFGCTSRGQAIRLGRWALYSNNNETETITFVAGLEANLLRCGDVFEVFDSNRKTKRYGGRVISMDSISNPYTTIVLDSNLVTDNNVEYSISLLTPTFYYDPSQVTGLTSNDYNNIYRPALQTFNIFGNAFQLSGSYTVVSLPQLVDSTNYNVTGNPVWSIQLAAGVMNYTGSIYFSNIYSDQYRVLNIKETDSNKYEIIGLSYWPLKFPAIDSGIVYEYDKYPSPTINTNFIPATPYNLNLTTNPPGSLSYPISYSYLVNNFTNITSFIINISTGNGIPLVNEQTEIVVPGGIIQGVTKPYIYSGAYNFSVVSYNSTYGLYSTGAATGAITVYPPLQITNITIGSLSIIN